MADSKCKRTNQESDSCKVLVSFLPLFVVKNSLMALEFYARFCVWFCTEMSSLLQFIKLKIISDKIFVPVLFTSIKLVAKTWAHFPRQTSNEEEGKSH